MNWGHSSLAMKSRQFDLVKLELEMAKTINTRKKS